MKRRKKKQFGIIQNWRAHDLACVVYDVTNSKIPYEHDAQIADKVAAFMHLYSEVSVRN